jgi:hypothetical protein
MKAESMELPKVNFGDIIIKDKYVYLKQQFLTYDLINERYLGLEWETEMLIFNTSKVNVTMFLDYDKIINSDSKESDDLIFFEEMFIKDFLFPIIDNTYDTHVKSFEERRIIEGKYSIDEKTGYYNELEDYLLKCLDKLHSSTHLSNSVVAKMQDKINELRDYIIDRLGELSISGDMKVPFNMSRENLAIIFALLYKNNLISNTITIRELSMVIEENFFHSKNKEITEIRNLIYKYTKPNSLKNKKRIEIKNILFEIFS